MLNLNRQLDLFSAVLLNKSNNFINCHHWSKDHSIKAWMSKWISAVNHLKCFEPGTFLEWGGVTVKRCVMYSHSSRLSTSTSTSESRASWKGGRGLPAMAEGQGCGLGLVSPVCLLFLPRLAPSLSAPWGCELLGAVGEACPPFCRGVRATLGATALSRLL